MPKPYDIEVRCKVLKQLQGGKGVREVSEEFGLGLKTIYRWIAREKLGQLAPFKKTSRKS
ncbi:MAG: hypothetical protein A2007_03710 [Verrucomicrobia bacterium GWC2_42_7]|nr:MAG: hypothetical protein A2007_03710 [Verrucomicrobia bacterium GWC2_42_7]